MRHLKSYSIILLLVFPIVLNAQNIVFLNIPNALVADAGNDATVAQYEQVSLGGNPTAQFGMSPYQYSWAPITGLNDPFSANPIATIEDSITYTLEVNDANGCTETSQVTLNITTIGVNELVSGKDITISPNPSTGNFTIHFLNPTGEATLSLSDIHGKILKTKIIKLLNIAEHPYDISQFPAGQYLLTITTSEFSITRSIIKNK